MDKNSVYITGMIFLGGITIYCTINGITGIAIGSMIILFLLMMAYR